MITYYTPTYNRANELKLLYQSLLNQDNLNFLWLVLNDGSTDETYKLLEQWYKEKYINIQYLNFRFNQGKTHMDNIALSLCCTDMFCPIDSDSSLFRNATSTILSNYNRLDTFSGYIYHQSDSISDTIIGDQFPEFLKSCRIFDLYNKYGIRGDKIIVLKKDSLNTFQYPILKSQKFMPEEILYSYFLNKADFLLCNIIIGNTSYSIDGLSRTMSLVKLKNPISFVYMYTVRLFYIRSNFFEYLAVFIKSPLQILYLLFKVLWFHSSLKK